jgi:hypothetical protein
MKTAVQELISEFEELKKTKLYSISFKAIDDCINLAYAKLELEKQQIIDAVEETISEMNLYESFRTLESGEQYYEQTFKK